MIGQTVHAFLRLRGIISYCLPVSAVISSPVSEAFRQRLMSADFNRIKTLDNSAVWEDEPQDLQSRVQFKLDSSQKRGKDGYSLNFFE